MSAGSVFLFVLAGHLLGDFIVQTDWQASHKADEKVFARTTKIGTRYGGWLKPMFWHVASYTLCMEVVVFLGLNQGVSGKLNILLVVSAITHAFIDRRWPVRWLLKHTGSPWFAEQLWGQLCVDQALHISILAITTGVLWR